MLSPVTGSKQDLQAYQGALHFPPALEREFLRDFGQRHPPILRRYFAFGLALYMAFAVLDYWALPIYYPTAWALRLIFGAVMLRLIFHTQGEFFKRSVMWISAAWTSWAGISILIMILDHHRDLPRYRGLPSGNARHP
jgi:hypothetical protein